MKTELLIQMDGLARSNALVFVLAATNMPWELDMVREAWGTGGGGRGGRPPSPGGREQGGPAWGVRD